MTAAPTTKPATEPATGSTPANSTSPGAARAHPRARIYLPAREGAAAIDLDIGHSRDELRDVLDRTIAANDMTDGVHIRLMVTRGRKRTPNQDPRHAIGSATVVVVDRPGGSWGPPPGWEVRRVEVPRLEISSTDLRQRVVDGRPLDYLVPAPVVSGIERLGLYREPR